MRHLIFCDRLSIDRKYHCLYIFNHQEETADRNQLIRHTGLTKGDEFSEGGLILTASPHAAGKLWRNGMQTWLIIIFTIVGTAAVLKLLHAFAIIVAYPVTQGAMYTSTARVKIHKALDAVVMKPGKLFVDIGCGDGRVLREARKHYGVICHGFEVNPIAFLKALIFTIGDKNIKVFYRNFWRVDLRRADVVACYLFPDVMWRLGMKLAWELVPGARVISFNFPIPGWKPQSVLRVESKLHNDPIYIYHIPESLPGRHSVSIDPKP